MSRVVQFVDNENSEMLPTLVSLCQTIFEIDPNKLPLVAPADIDQWKLRIRDSKGEVAYVMDDTNSVPAAIAITYQRNKTDPSQLHIWVAGCHESHRRLGLMTSIFSAIEDRARLQGYKSLTVNTYPDKFHNMPQFLNSSKYRQISSEMQPGENGLLTEKVSYLKEL